MSSIKHGIRLFSRGRLGKTAKNCTKRCDTRAKFCVFKPIALMTFSLSSLSSDLKVPIAFVTCWYHTLSSIKERADSLLSYSISSVKDVIVFPSFHIFALVDGQKRTRILFG